MAIGLVAICIVYLRAALQLPSSTDPDSIARGKREGLRLGIFFGLIFLLEGAAIALVSSFVDDPNVLVPVIMAIVGLHFLPLAALFHVRQYYATGILWVLIVATTFLAFSASSMVGEISVWIVVPVIGCTVVTWLTVAYVVAEGRSAIRTAA